MSRLFRSLRSLRLQLVAGAVAVAGAVPGTLHSDALIVTRAMLATTIAEVFIEADSVIVELEIGAESLAAFQNLLPDQLYERLGNEPRPWAERLGSFFDEDFVIRGASDVALPGVLTAVEPRPRVRRDEVTGEPLPVPADEEEPVVFARLAYPLPGQPNVISITPPGAENEGPMSDLGFVAYHRGLPINDFRYLGARETLDLDWDDPWYSRFRNRNLWRQYDAPISTFLYVEPYEVRKEVVLRPRDLEEWIDLGLAGLDTLRTEDQEELKARVVEFLSPRNPVTIDGVEVEGRLDRIHFIYRNLRTSGVVDPPRDLDLVSATLGVIWTYPIEGLPEHVSMRWELFGERYPRVPASVTDEAGGLPYYLTRGDEVLEWTNFLTNPTIPGLVEVQRPGGSRVWTVTAILSVLAFLVLLARYGTRFVRKQPVTVAAAALTGLLLVTSLLSVPMALRGGLSEDETAQVLSGILMNIYRSFDFREEERIYDMLANSASGDLLTDIYLETRQSLELENQGGARAKVKEVEVLEASHDPIRGRGFRSRATWNVAGSVGHWGHVHQRINQYVAEFTVEEVDGVWKVTSLEILQEERLPGSTV
jgi:hypothetical protein